MAPADLYYGFDLGDMTDRETWDSLKPEWMEDSRDWEEVLAEKLGWNEVPFPEDICPEQPVYTPNRHQYDQIKQRYKEAKEAFKVTPEYQAWSASRDAMWALVKDYDVELDSYGYIDEPNHCVRVKTSVQTVGDYGSIELKPLVVEGDWDAKVIEFMKLMELPIPTGEMPGWHLSCSYG